MKKWILRVVIGVVLLVVVIVVGALLTIDSLAKTAVEKGSEHALGVRTTLDSMSVGLVRGHVGMSGLEVANPEGFQTPHLLQSGQFELEVRPGSLLSDTVEVPLLRLDGLDLNVEQQLAGSNVQRILEHLKRFGGGPRDEPAEPGKKVQLDRVVIRNVTARFTMLPGLGDEGVIAVDVPEIELTHVTSENAGGVAIGEIVARVLPAILAAVFEEAQGQVPGSFLGDLDSQLADTQKALGGKAESLLRQATSDLLPAREDDEDRAGNRLEGLLPGLAPEEAE